MKMTNKEMYEKIFGMPAETSNCPTSDCSVCPCGMKDNKGGIACYASRTHDWWNSEYKEINK